MSEHEHPVDTLPTVLPPYELDPDAPTTTAPLPEEASCTGTDDGARCDDGTSHAPVDEATTCAAPRPAGVVMTGRIDDGSECEPLSRAGPDVRRGA